MFLYIIEDGSYVGKEVEQLQIFSFRLKYSTIDFQVFELNKEFQKIWSPIRNGKALCHLTCRKITLFFRETIIFLRFLFATTSDGVSFNPLDSHFYFNMKYGSYVGK